MKIKVTLEDNTELLIDTDIVRVIEADEEEIN